MYALPLHFTRKQPWPRATATCRERPVRLAGTVRNGTRSAAMALKTAVALICGLQSIGYRKA